MPFHVWLPNAHPAAPAHVSGMLSAINIKAGIYGIMRMMMILPVLDAVLVWVGIAGRLAHLGRAWRLVCARAARIKKLLAYHSVENIGIIGLGMSVAWLGRCYALPELVVLGFAGALLHTLNHAIFKGLLFFGAGNVYLHAHTGNIEKMGGFARVIPLTAVAFLVGAISICGLPPFNGFASEFLVYKVSSGRAICCMALLLWCCCARWSGWRSWAGWQWLVSRNFTGSFSSAQIAAGADSRRQSEHRSSTVALFGLAALCAVFGIFPQIGLRLIAPALGEFGDTAHVPGGWTAPLGQLQVVFALFLGLVAAVYAAKFLVQRGAGVRRYETWSCGYEAVTSRMQYTASGFAEELVKLGRPMLATAVHWVPLSSIMPVASGFHSHCHDRMENFWLALHRAIGGFLGAFRWIQSGNIRHYVLYTFAAVLFYLLCALVW